MYDLISSSTVALSSVFLLLNLASYYRGDLASYDIKGAFLNAEFGPNDETTYIKINRQITEIWVSMDPSALPFVDDRGELILELDKFIYGLKQSPKKFQDHLKAVLILDGYVQLGNDECLFIKRTSDPKLFSIISVHVDDILQMSTDPTLITELRRVLTKAYGNITFHPNADAYIGMTITRGVDKRDITVSQLGLIEKILEQYNPNDTKTCKDPHTDDLFDPESGDNTAIDRKIFLGLIMSLMYLARLTRPDILMPVTFLATRSHCCTKSDMHQAIRVCRYLRGTKNIAVNIHCVDLQLRCLCDASYQVHMDGKSHTGFIITLGAMLSYIHARSGKQKLTALSSTDSEILAMVECLKMATWIRNILIELNIEQREAILVYQDNQSAIKMTGEDSKTTRSKHILNKITYLKELHKLAIMELEHLGTDDMTADVLTKPLHGLPFIKHRSTMMGYDVYDV